MLKMLFWRVMKMELVIDDFNKRVSEINSYLKGLEELELYSLENDELDNKKFLEDDFSKILKSNALLMMYNLVESTILGGILKIYEGLVQNEMTYTKVRTEIKNIWFSFRHNEAYDKKAHYNSYRKKASDIVDFILSDEVLVLNRKAINISGNLDADQIRGVCQEHGIVFNPNQESRGGIVLEDIKDKRNSLAHGSVSFVECGRDYSVLRLMEIRKETVLFLKAVLDGMQDYYDNERYLMSETAI